MERYDVIVVGAGISGLSLANYSAEAGLKTLLLEKSEHIGGCFHTHRFAGSAEGFWLELGAHTCYNSYGGLLSLMEKHGLLPSLLKREKVPFRMLVDGKISSITSQLSFAEILASAWRLFALKKEGESVASYYSQIVGPRNFQRVFAPAFNAVISQRADDFPADMLFNKRPRRKDILRSFTVAGGLQTITDTFATRQGLTLAAGVTITAVTTSGRDFQLATADGRSYAAGHLALATPPSEAAALLHGIEPEIATLLDYIRMETIETVGVAIPRRALKLDPLAGIIAPSDSFYSAVSRDTVPHDSWRGFSFHFKAGQLSLDAKLQRICEVLAVARADIHHVANRENRLPSPVVGHKALIAALDQHIAGRPLLITGNYFAGLAIEDCISRSRAEFGRLTAQTA